MSTNTVLVLDGNPQRCRYIKDILEFIDYEPIVCADMDQLESISADQVIHAVFVGEQKPESQGADVFGVIKSRFGDLPILQLVEEGAEPIDDMPGRLPYLTLPLKHRLLNQLLSQLKSGDQSHSRLVQSADLFRSLVGDSPAIKRIHKFIQQVADTEVNVLVLGESGTGKEVVARNLHYYSRRRNRPFVPVNCGAIPSELLESELFGHEKGAFTGAICTRQGRFEMADGGTLFLDEIGDMSLPMQVKLLRVLEERTFERVGSNRTLHCNVRIVAATHRRLEEEIERNRFREDLYYRLNVSLLKCLH
jgi:sigma-54 specific flagellar transcriptional regulator A